MTKNSFWTERRFAGILLMLGFLLYVAAVIFMPRDTQGTLLVLLPDRAALLLVAAQPSLTSGLSACSSAGSSSPSWALPDTMPSIV